MLSSPSHWSAFLNPLLAGVLEGASALLIFPAALSALLLTLLLALLAFLLALFLLLLPKLLALLLALLTLLLVFLFAFLPAHAILLTVGSSRLRMATVPSGHQTQPLGQ